uniref:L-lactate dehydrogenase n=1 Tax=uncultured Micrococcus sp. TaxID=114051 RepID=UPI0026069D30|nr:L-lactate dehydrogenase [uncultured Micrococcus sp.]
MSDQRDPAPSPAPSPWAVSDPGVPAQRKVGVVGAGGVGTAIAYATLIRGVAREVALYDIDEPKVRAEVLDLAHGTPFTSADAMTGGADPAVLAEAEIVVVTAGAKQKPGQTRLDLAERNVAILHDLLPRVQAAAPDALIVLVTNPVDVLTLVAQRITGLPAGRVIGSGTLLDTSRLRWLLAGRAGVHTSSVHASILGEHGDTEFPAWSSARIGPMPILEWPDAAAPLFSLADLDAIAHTVTNAAYEVIQGKGATTYAVGVATTRLLEAVLRDQHAILPVSTVLDGPHGLHDVALSLPAVVGRAGVERVIPLELDAAETAKLQASAAALRATAARFGF